jgi:hypothetical protein
MSLQEIQDEVARLSPEDRAKLRAHLDHLELFSNPAVMQELTESNRQARAGRVHSREEVIAAIQKAS